MKLIPVTTYSAVSGYSPRAQDRKVSLGFWVFVKGKVKHRWCTSNEAGYDEIGGISKKINRPYLPKHRDGYPKNISLSDEESVNQSRHHDLTFLER